jgi:hypothetical protein
MGSGKGCGTSTPEPLPAPAPAAPPPPPEKEQAQVVCEGITPVVAVVSFTDGDAGAEKAALAKLSIADSPGQRNGANLQQPRIESSCSIGKCWCCREAT